MLYKRKHSKVWWTKFKVDGETVRKSTGETDRRRAASEARRIQVEYEEKHPPQRGPIPDLAALGAADIESAGKRGTTEAHQKRLKSLWGVVVKNMGSVTVDKIDFEALDNYVGKRRKAGIRGQTIRREISAIKRALRIAKRRGHIAELPDEWPVVKSDPPDPKLKGNLIPPQIIQAVLEEVPGEVRDQLHFALLTGLRDAEVKRVEASWIEPTKNPNGKVQWILRVPAAAAKDRDERIVGLTEPSLEILKRRMLNNPAATKLFPQKNTKKALDRAAKRLSLTNNVTMRDMRHTYATLAMQGTADPIAVQAALGHSDLKMTQRYLSTTIERTASASAAVANQIAKTVKGGHSRGAQLRRKEILSRRKDRKARRKLGFLERAMGLEPTTLSLGIAQNELSIDYYSITQCNKQQAISSTYKLEGAQQGGTVKDQLLVYDSQLAELVAAHGVDISCINQDCRIEDHDEEPDAIEKAGIGIDLIVESLDEIRRIESGPRSIYALKDSLRFLLDRVSHIPESRSAAQDALEATGIPEATLKHSEKTTSEDTSKTDWHFIPIGQEWITKDDEK